jgi:hypothetical protein
MNHHNTSPSENTMNRPVDDASDDASDNVSDDAFDRALRQHFDREAQPGDDGFSQRVMAALPVRVVRRRVGWTEWALHGQWVAISLAGCTVAALMSASEGRGDVGQSLAAYVLIGLLVFWSIPNRWSRG